jgi:predicted ribosomally synthesized peptide with SipW-like signal peptide
MSVKLKVAWILSIVVTAMASAGLLGAGTSASFSDSVVVTHEIRTGRVEILLTAVDGKPLTDPSDSHHLTDMLSGTTVDLKHQLTLHNDGTLDIGDLTLTTSPSPADIAPEMAKLILKVSYAAPDGGTATESHPLSYWLASPRTVATDLGLPSGHDLDVEIHLTGKLATRDQDPTTELTYRFTGSA